MLNSGVTLYIYRLTWLSHDFHTVNLPKWIPTTFYFFPLEVHFSLTHSSVFTARFFVHFYSVEIIVNCSLLTWGENLRNTKKISLLHKFHVRVKRAAWRFQLHLRRKQALFPFTYYTHSRHRLTTHILSIYLIMCKWVNTYSLYKAWDFGFWRSFIATSMYILI